MVPANLLFFDKFMLVLISSIGAWLAVLVYIHARKEKLNLYFGLMILFLIVRLDLAYFGYISPEAGRTVYWFRVSTAAGILFLLSSYYFYVLYFLKEKGKNLLLERTVLLLSLFFSAVSCFTGWIVESVTIEDWGPNVGFGGLNGIFDVFIVSLSSMIFYYFIKRYFSLSELEKSQVFYLLVGASIFGLANVVFIVIFPIFLGTVKYSPLGNYSTIFFFIFTAYAVIKRGLFDVKIIFTTLLVAFITVLLLLDALLLTSNDYFEILKIAIIFIFVYFGYLLIRSITQEVNQREKLQNITNELKNLNLHLQEKIDEQVGKVRVAYEIEKKAHIKLEDLNKIKDEFISTAAHQLRTPLSVTKWALKSILDGTYEEKDQRQLIEKVYLNNNRLINIVGDLLNIASVEEKGFSYNFQENDMVLLLKEIVSASAFLMAGKNLNISFHDQTTGLPLFKFDRSKISLALENIISNAIDYTHEGGVIDVVLREEDNKVLIQVKDDGIGILDKDKRYIYEKFYRGENAKKIKTDRSGLGLYITKNIINAHRGSVWAESDGDGKGSTFVVELPIN
jgi:signal transduction histidine kinase